MGENEATGWLLMKGRFATVPSLHALSVFIAFMPLVFGTPLVITITIHPIMLISMELTGEEPRVEVSQIFPILHMATCLLCINLTIHTIQCQHVHCLETLRGL